VLLGGGFAAGYATGHSPVPGYQQQIATTHNTLGAEQVKLAAEKVTLQVEQGQVTTARQTAHRAEAAVQALHRKLQREHRKLVASASSNASTGSSSPPAAAATAAFGCKILQIGSGGQEKFNVTTTGGASYIGTVNVTFYDYPGSGDTFPPTSVQGATPVGSWQPVPAADIGASAEPAGCIASAG
jgi:hypothetical protein